jgi:hypothetical protein
MTLKIKLRRNSLLIAVPKARDWAEEGWNVVVTDKQR